MPHIKKIASLAIFLAFMVASGTLNIARAESPTFDIRNRPIREVVTYLADQYGVDSRLALSVMECESHGIQSTVGDSGHALGIYQYWDSTWKRLSIKYFGTVLDRNSPYDQAKVTMASFLGGDGNEWTTYVSIKNGGTYSFYSKSLRKHFVVKCGLM